MATNGFHMFIQHSLEYKSHPIFGLILGDLYSNKYGSFCLSVLSRLKSPVPLLNRNRVVYKINCLNCDEFYIGMTNRRIYKRCIVHSGANNTYFSTCYL